MELCDRCAALWLQLSKAEIGCCAALGTLSVGKQRQQVKWDITALEKAYQQAKDELANHLKDVHNQ